jgi:hypothetical protein
VAALFWFASRHTSSVVSLIAAAHRLGPSGPLLFIVIYSVAVIVLIPASWMTMAGGAVFGLLPAVVYALVAATYRLDRRVSDRTVRRARICRAPPGLRPRFAAIDRAVSADARRIIMLLRLSPVTPFNVLNYGLGLTAISVWDFMIGSLGMIPGSLHVRLRRYSGWTGAGGRRSSHCAAKHVLLRDVSGWTGSYRWRVGAGRSGRRRALRDV